MMMAMRESAESDDDAFKMLERTGSTYQQQRGKEI